MNKKILTFLCLMIFLFTITSVSASDLDNSIIPNEDFQKSYNNEILALENRETNANSMVDLNKIINQTTDE